MQDLRNHPKLKNRFFSDASNDVQVVVHEGGPRTSTKKPELVWVTVTSVKENVFKGRIINQPNQLDTIKKGDVITFLAPAGDQLLMVTDKYLLERASWRIHGCNQCDLDELYDPPSELIKASFDVMGAEVVEKFTAFCGSCGGVQIVSLAEEISESEGADNQTMGEPNTIPVYYLMICIKPHRDSLDSEMIREFAEVLGKTPYEARQFLLRPGLRVLQVASEAGDLHKEEQKLRKRGLNAAVVESDTLSALGSAERAYSVQMDGESLCFTNKDGSEIMRISPGARTLIAAGDLKGETVGLFSALRQGKLVDHQGRLQQLEAFKEQVICIYSFDQDNAAVIRIQGFDFSNIIQVNSVYGSLATLVEAIRGISDDSMLDINYIFSDLSAVRVRADSITLPHEDIAAFELYSRCRSFLWRQNIKDPLPKTKSTPQMPANTSSPSPSPSPASEWTKCTSCGLRYRTNRTQCPRCKQNEENRSSSSTTAKSPFIAPVVAGAITAILGGLLWVGIVNATGYEVGYVAWFMGVMVGAVVRMAGGHYTGIGWLIAGGMATFGLVLGKVLVISSLKVPWIPDFYDLIWFALAIGSAAQICESGKFE